ncbi:MAG: PocR ligand-binding domain-containing protein [Desulfocurvibacter africanus]
MTLTDIMPVDGWRKLEEDLHAFSHMNSCVFDSQGRRITDYANWGNKLCPRIKSNPQGLQAICACANQVIARHAEQRQDAVLEECDAGFAKLVVPVIRDGQFLGVVGCCGLLLDGSQIESDYVSRVTGLPVTEIEDLAASIPVISRQRAQEIIAFIQKRLTTL